MAVEVGPGTVRLATAVEVVCSVRELGTRADRIRVAVCLRGRGGRAGEPLCRWVPPILNLNETI